LERGYAGTRIEDIIQQVGIAKGTFYHHYQSKADVLEAVIESLISHFITIMEEISLRDCSAGEKLTLMWNSLGNIVGSSEVIAELLADDESAAFLLRLIRKGLESSVGVYQRVVEQGIREGSIRTPYPEAAAQTFAALDVLIFSVCSPKERHALGHFAEKILETDKPYLTGDAGSKHREDRA